MNVIVYDFGTSNLKTCLFNIDSEVRMVATSSAAYNLYVLKNGGAEQDVEEWWQAVCSSTKEVLCKANVAPEHIAGLAFCSQMQGVVLVDEQGKALRRPMAYMDTRAKREYNDGMCRGILKVSGRNLFKLVRNLRVNYAGPVSAKDPLWKYKWVENNEPEVFAKVYKWLDVGDYLLMRCTGKIVRTADSAFSTFLYDTRPGKEGWNAGLVKMYGVRPEHLAPIVECSDLVGGLTKEAARDLGLKEGTSVFGGGGDTTFVNIGAGCTRPGDTHINLGTSGWVSTFLDRQTVDLNAMIAGVLSVKRGYFNYYAELETAGKCFEWVTNHIALDEIGVYFDRATVADDAEGRFANLYDYLSDEVSKTPPGANGVIFTPWLHGNRCPFEDTAAAGMFFNLRLETGKRDMIRAVVEGVCYHLRWLLECESRTAKISDPVRFVGGGTRSSVGTQILADILGHTVEVVEGAREAGAAGTALMVAAGVRGVDVLELAQQLVKVKCVYVPNPANKAVYERNYQVFKRLYKANAAGFKALNAHAT